MAKKTKLPENTVEVAKASVGDTIVCRLTKPMTGAQYANLVTKLKRTEKLNDVRVVVLPYELEVEEVKKS